MLLALVLAPVASSAGQGGVDSLPPDDRRYALLIGVSDYDDEDRIGSFKSRAPDNDVTRLRDVLVANAGFLPENVFVLSSGSSDASKKPTRPNILKVLNRLESEVPSDGLFLFFFSGHGITVQGSPFLLPADAVYFSTAKKMADVSLGLDTIKASVEAMAVSQVIVLMDACRNDPRSFAKGDSPNLLTAAFKKGLDLSSLVTPVTAYATLFATSEGHRAYIDDNSKQGFFAGAIVEALQGVGGRDVVTLQNVMDHVQAVVPERVRKQLGQDAIQVPDVEVKGYRPGQLELARSNFVVRVSKTPRQSSLFIEGDFELGKIAASSARPFVQRGASINVGCEEANAVSVEFRRPSPQASFDPSSLKVVWVDLSNIKEHSASVSIVGDRVVALGTIHGLDRQRVFGLPVNCPGGGHATLEVSGTYQERAVVSDEYVGFKRSLLGDSLHVRVPRREGFTAKSMVLRAVGAKGEILDRLKVSLDPRQNTTVLSERGRFLATVSDSDVIAVLPASRVVTVDEPGPPVETSSTVLSDSSRARIGRSASAVGELQVLDNSRQEVRCVAFLVGEDVAITSSHCVDNFSRGSITFGAGADRSAFAVEVAKVNVETDVALLRVKGRPGDTFGITTIAAAMPQQASSITLVQAERAQLRCEVIGVEGSSVLHSCGGGAGSAGSPLMSEDGTVVGMHVRRGLQGHNVAVGPAMLRAVAPGVQR